MSEVVIEVGPATIRGANEVRPEWVSTALDCIDDEIALLDDRPVSVRDLWDDVMNVVIGGSVDVAVVICPAWWWSARIDRAREAAQIAATEVVVLERTAMLREGISVETTIVEITADVAVVSVLGTIAAVVPLQAEAVTDAGAVTAAVGVPSAVLLDAPATVPGAEFLASKIADRMRAIGVRVMIADDNWVLRAAAAKRSAAVPGTDAVTRASAVFRARKTLAALAGILTVVVLCGGLAAARDSRPDPSVGDMPMTLLIEGRTAVMVPAAWTAERITSGPGSARVQVVSPANGDVALHITQSVASQPSSLAATADSLVSALAETADGVFVEFNPSDRRVGRDAVTYREVRPERHVAWTVIVDGAVRIAVGCQSMPGREQLVREACDRAIRSAHAVP
ncbi:type VII secretion-associated protein [Mycobacterium sp. 2YAF39]|uniref:type VII secretion-associated protein n=1 Tax=Mycobacterium sp. 2YAF39 TaxID=3233033 RepID=UPI003F946BC5